MIRKQRISCNKKTMKNNIDDQPEQNQNYTNKGKRFLLQKL